MAIMQKSLGFLEKILEGSKKIESRWYSAKRTPWGNIKHGETIFFKNSGCPVSARAKAGRVIQFSDLNPVIVLEILKKYGKDIGVETREIPEFYARFKDKKYCVLIYLNKARKIKPFNINKKGFGAMSAWIAVDSVKNIQTFKHINI